MLTGSFNADSPPAKYALPDSNLLNANNLASTPASKALHPLIEDESQISPHKASKSLFQDSIVRTEQWDATETLTDVSSEEHERMTLKGEDETEKESKETEINNDEYGETLQPDDVEKKENSGMSEEGEFPLKIGDTIELGGGDTGRVRFLGETCFASGVWAGLELTNPRGMWQTFSPLSYLRFRSSILICSLVLKEGVI